MGDVEYIGKCLFLKDKEILVVGDLHLGYEEVMNRTGVFISRYMFDEYVKYLDRVFEKIKQNGGNIKKIVLLGDVKHNFSGILRQEWDDVLNLFDYFLDKTEKIIVVKGNHDNILEPIVKKNLKVELLDYYINEKYCFLHGDRDFEEIYDKNIKYWIMGHTHPAVKLKDEIKVEKYKCFLEGIYKGKKIIVVPSFIEASEGTDLRENENKMAWNLDFNKFDVYVVGEDLEVLKFGKLSKL